MRTNQFADISHEGLTALTTDNINEWMGKRIYFYSQQYKANYDAEGIGVITGFDPEKKNDSIAFECEEGDTLKYAFVSYWSNNLCLGDEERYIMVKAL